MCPGPNRGTLPLRDARPATFPPSLVARPSFSAWGKRAAMRAIPDGRDASPGRKLVRMSSQHPLVRFVDALYVLAGSGTLLSRVINAAALLADVNGELLPDHHRILFRRLLKVMAPEVRALAPVTDGEARFWASWIAETTLDLARQSRRTSIPAARPTQSERPSLAPN